MAILTACPRCRTVVPPGLVACLRCGHPTEVATRDCPACEGRNDRDARFCARCGHLLDAPAEQPAAPVLPADTTRVFVDHRTHRIQLRGGLAAFLALAVLIGGLQVAERSYFRPEATVARFFDALLARDSTAARDLLLIGDTSGAPLLDSAALRSPGYLPPVDVDVEEAEEVEEDGVATVRAGFTLQGERRSATFRLSRDEGRVAGLFHRWRIDDGLDQVIVQASGVESVQVAGAVVPVDQDRSYAMLDALPGGYRVSLPEDPLWEATPVVAYAGTTGDADQEVTLEPAVKSSARAELDRQVRAHIDDCAKSTVLQPRGCSLHASSWYEVRDVRWKVLRYPEVEVTLGYAGELTLSTTSEGEATATGREVYAFGGGTRPYEHPLSIDVSGGVVVKDGAVTFVPR